MLQYLSQSVVRIKSSSKWHGCISEFRINKILKRPNVNQLRKGKNKKWNFFSPLHTAVTFLRAKKKDKLGANQWCKKLEIREAKYSVLGV